ncbi:MAG: endonuclease MutS2 [Chitinophagales bacterium]
MNIASMQALEFDKVLERVSEYAMTEGARLRINNLTPSADLDQIRSWMNETTEARAMLDQNSSVPIPAMENLPDLLTRLNKGMVLTPGDLDSCRQLLESVKRIQKYMDSMQFVGPQVASYALSMYELADLREEITKSIINNQVDDRASAELARIRKRIIIAEDRIKQKLNDVLKSSAYAAMLQDVVALERMGRHVVPVRRQFSKTFPGHIIDYSSTGATVFMEPSAIAKFHDELNRLQAEEEAEVFRILTYLTGLVEESARELSINVEAITHYDFIFAKAKYSRELNMRSVELNTRGKTVIVDGRHPLLGSGAVPLNFHIGVDYRALIITGPNTGGKTVALKSIGLITMMCQAGMHAPVGEESEIAIFSDILVDIGDGQSIEQSLSTFSAHVRNIITIVNCSDPSTLVIMDELGAGTDPGEGRGFAIAVLEEIYARGATIVSTTHLGEIKEFASRAEGFRNGRMEFDLDNLQPLYQLRIGSPGDSHAFLIALRLGMEPRLIERAHEITYGEKTVYSPVSLGTAEVTDRAAIQTHQEESRSFDERETNKARRERSQKYVKEDFKRGDRVYISTMGRTGIVCEEENSKGDLVVMVMKKKYRINKQRLSLHLSCEELYPEDYDLDVVLESKENRKKRKIMSKHHIEGLVIEVKDDIEPL